MKRAKWILVVASLLLATAGVLIWKAGSLERPVSAGGDGVSPGSESQAAGEAFSPGAEPVAPPDAAAAVAADDPAPGGTTPSPTSPTSGPAGGPSRVSGGPAGPGPAADAGQGSSAPPDVAALLAGVDLSNPSERERVAVLIAEQEEAYRLSVVQKARALGLPEFVKKPEGGVMEIFDFEGDEPVYRTTFNRNAGISSGADLLRGGGFANLTGRGLKVGVWDGGSVRPTHQEFGEEQVTLRNADRPYSWHATHVAATLGGIGFQPEAMGMAPGVTIDSYFWRNDHGEMLLAGAALPSGETGRIPLSNHSYGIVFTSRSSSHYERLARATDAVAYGLPHYLQFWAAGNAQRESPDKPPRYNTITHYQLAKNIVTVGAVNDAVDGGLRDTNAATMSTFSSWGPVRDGRIKPDLVANGVDVYSAIDFSDQSYAIKPGTSMASPSAAGTAALLVELYRREFAGRLPTASLLKAILIHTADDLGREGPDYEFGWGLINGEAAGALINEHRVSPRFFEAAVSTDARRWTHTFSREAGNPVPIRATLVWTDPPGEVRTAASREPNLVHDLDLKIVGPDGTESFPYVMPYVGDWSTASLSAPATTGKNDVDNVEQVDIDGDGDPGTYTVVVTADGPMLAAQQFSVVLTGAGAPVNQSPVVTLQSPQSGDWFLPGRSIPMRATATDLQDNGSPGVVARVEFLVDGERVGEEDTTAPYEYDWEPAGPGTYTLEAVAHDSEGAAGYSNPVVIEVRESLPGELHPAFTPPTADGAVFALAEDAEGRIYIGGLFTRLNGSVDAPRLARLTSNGEVDAEPFVVGAGPNGRVRVLQFNPGHNALYVAGDFTHFGAAERAGLARLHIGHEPHVDGALDETFTVVIGSSHPLIKPSVRAVLVEPDGKIVIGGLFDSVQGEPRANLARLHPDGTLDEEFDPSPNGSVAALVRQADGKILLGGEFTALGTTTRNRLARVHSDGRNDGGLVLGTGQQTGFNGPIYALATDSEGNILAGGAFTAYRGHPFHANLVKLEPNGTLIGSFNFEPGLNGTVHDVSVHAEDRVLAAGAFTSVGNTVLGMRVVNRGRLLMFSADGQRDDEFNAGGTGADGTVSRVLPLRSGHILLAGSFGRFNGTPSARLALLGGLEPAGPGMGVGAPRMAMGSRAVVESAAGSHVDVLVLEAGEQVVGDIPPTALPRGLNFDAGTGRVSGVALEAGRFEVTVGTIGSDGRVSDRLVEIFVEPAAVSYDQWRAAWFGPGLEAFAGPQVISSRTGRSYFEIYALSGGDPRNVPADWGPRIEVLSPQGVQWQSPIFPLANYGAVTNVIYQPEVAPHPGGPWEPVEAEVADGWLRVRRDQPAGKEFFRLNLIQP